MEQERGLMRAGHRLDDALNQILLASPVDDIRVSENVALTDTAWQFQGEAHPRPIVMCDRDRLLHIVDALLKEIAQLQKTVRVKDNLDSIKTLYGLKNGLP